MLENVGILAAFGAMLFWGFGDFFIQKTTRRLGNIEALFFIGVFGSIVLLPFVLKELPLALSNTRTVFGLTILGIFTLVVAVINFQALKIGKLAIIEPILEFELPITIIVAMLVLQEQLTLYQLLFATLLFVGILLISFSKIYGGSKSLLEKGVFLAVATAVGMGLLNFYTGVLARETSPLLAIWFAWTIFGAICLAYLLPKRGLSGLISDVRGSSKIIFAESFFDTVAWVFFAIAMVTLPISLAVAITESYPAIAVLLGVLINKEIVRAHQYAGMSLALLSSVALAFI